MKRFVVKINNADCAVCINTWAQRRYAEKMGISDVNKTVTGLLEGIRVDENNMAHFTWDAYDRFAQFVFQGIVEAARIDKVTLDIDLADVYQIFETPEQLMNVWENIIGTLPAPEEKPEESGELQGNPAGPQAAD